MPEQRALARRADAGNFVERAFAHRLFALGAVRADGEAVRLVAQTLHEVQHRIVGREAEGRLAGHEKALAAGVSVGAFGDARNGEAVQAEFVQNLTGGGELPCAAVDEQEVRPRPHVAALGFCLVFDFVFYGLGG